MARPDGRIEKGQRLSSAISARAWNRAQEAADRVLGVSPGAEADVANFISYPLTRLKIKNDLLYDLERFEIVSVSWGQSPVPPGSNPEEDSKETRNFLSDPVVRQYSASGNAYGFNGPTQGKIACCVEPIKQSSFGSVALAGVMPAKVKFSSEAWRFGKQMALPVSVTNTETNATKWELWQNPFCGFKIAWTPGFDGKQWALVDFSSWLSEPVVFGISETATTAKLFVFGSNGNSLGDIADSGLVVEIRTDNFFGTISSDRPTKLWLRNPFSSGEFFARSADSGATLTLLPRQWDVISIETEPVSLSKQFTTINGVQVLADVGSNKDFPLALKTPKLA